MKIEVHNPGNLPTIDYRKLNPLQGNLKDFHEREYEKLKKSLSEFGWVYPFFVWFNPKDNLPYIMDGHGRHRFATREGIQPFELPYVQVEAENLTQAKKLLLVATSQYQRITQEGFDEFTFDLEDDWLKETVNFDGVFSDVEIPEEEPEAHEDDYEAPDEIKTDIVLGDLFEIGKHRLLCGDSTDSDSVARLMDGQEPYLMITDPPYGVSYNPGWRDKAERANGKSIGAGALGKVRNDDNADWTASWALSPSKVGYVYHADKFVNIVAQSLQNCGFELVNLIIWAKNNFAISRGNYHHKHEPCWYVCKKGATRQWIGGHSQTTLWEIDKPRKSETGHGTQKPIECMSRPLANHDGDVYDPFLGSGSTMVAAHRLNRKCYGMELDPKYCQVIVDRMIKLDPSIEIKRNGEPYNSKN